MAGDMCARLGGGTWEGRRETPFTTGRDKTSYAIVEKSLEIWQESRVRFASEDTKPHFLPTIPVMNRKGWGGATNQISCRPQSLFSAWFATVLQCVRIYIHAFVNHSSVQ